MVNPITVLLLTLSGEPPVFHGSFYYGLVKCDARLRQYAEPPTMVVNNRSGYFPGMAPDVGSGKPRRRGTRLIQETRGSPPVSPPADSIILISGGDEGATKHSRVGRRDG
jgi:hypothetical protein